MGDKQMIQKSGQQEVAAINASGELDQQQLEQVTGGMNKSDLIAAIATKVNDAKPSQR